MARLGGAAGEPAALQYKVRMPPGCGTCRPGPGPGPQDATHRCRGVSCGVVWVWCKGSHAHKT